MTIVGALDRIDLFELNGQLVLLVNSELRNLNNELLRTLLRENFASKHLVTAGAGLGVEFRPMLTAPPTDGGLLGRCRRQ
jgi:hypothetical protein